MNILGVSAYYHDAAAALLQDGKILAAAQEERFSRKKHDQGFPKNSVKFCLDFTGLDISELDYIVFYDKPLLKFERLLETYYAFAPRGIRSFLSAIPVWIKEKVFMKALIRRELKNIFSTEKGMPPILFTEHHLAHAASAFYPSPYSEAAILTVDGVGEWATTAISYGSEKDVTIIKQMDFPHSWGLLYSAFTYYLGFKVNSGEYKLMGLAPYGNPDSEETKTFERIIRDDLINLKSDGSVWLNMKYFKFPTGLKMVAENKWKSLFGLSRRLPESKITQSHMNLAYAIQKVIEDGIIRLAQETRRLTNCNNLVLAGGVALNCVANGKLLKTGLFENIWIQPASGDAGGAVGAAYACWHIYLGNERDNSDFTDKMNGTYLGPEYGELSIEKTARKFKAPYKKYSNFNDLTDDVAELLDKGNIIGWFQGRMEWGPRALGNRSILGDTRNSHMQKKLNLKIKYRESFRPFAPAVLSEDVGEYFKLETSSPYMLLVADVLEHRRNVLPGNFHELSLKEKLYFLRSDIPAVTHLDYSARVQTVHGNTNSRFWQLITAFKKRTGYGLIVNTSFNVRGEPIVCSPEDAYKCFMRTAMDYLVMGEYVFIKEDQEKWPETDNWKEEYPLD